jgi:predicted neutral ceramidase superfamily lipid hydrolase
MAAKGGPERLEAYERAWQVSAEFRHTHNVATSGLAVAFLADSILRIVIVYKFPLDRAMWLSNVPHVVAILLIMIVGALAGRRFKRIVDQEMATAR